MDYERVVKAGLRTIISDAEQRLGRPLRDHERRFIERRVAFVSLEAVHDKVLESTSEELESYLAGQRRGS